jgi:hypothetical protein
MLLFCCKKKTIIYYSIVSGRIIMKCYRYLCIYDMRYLFVFIILTIGFHAFGQNAEANSIVVTSIADNSNPNDGVVTLREAMTIAHEGGTTENGESIDKNQKVYIDLTQISGTILLTSRLPRIDKDLKIVGNQSLNLTIDGNYRHRIFFVYQGTLILSNLRLQNGQAKGGNATPWARSCCGGGGAGMGGALFVNTNSVAKCYNIYFLNNQALGGNGGQGWFHAYTFMGAGGGFYGNAGDTYSNLSGRMSTYYMSGGSGGYLGEEGKGGNSTQWEETNPHGGFGGGGGSYNRHYGGNGGFGGGAGCSSNDTSEGIPGEPGQFGGAATYSNAGGGAGLGGAVFVRETGTFTAIDCVFRENKANGGLEGNSGRHSGQGKGGAIFLHNENAIACVENCTFNENHADDSEPGEFSPAFFAHQDNQHFYGFNSPIVPEVKSICIEHYPPILDTEIQFRVEFYGFVDGLDESDFDFVADDASDIQISQIERIDDRSFLVTVRHSRREGYVALKIQDDDSIRTTTTDLPLGGEGIGNGDFIGETCYFYPNYFLDTILPLSGDLQEYGIKIQNGVELAIIEHNADNQPNKPIFLVYQTHDSKSPTETIETTVEQANNDENVLAIVGGAVSKTTLQMADLCAEKEIPLFSPTATSNELTDKEYVVNVVPSDKYQVYAIDRFLLQLTNATDFAIIAEDSEYGRGFLELDGYQTKRETPWTGSTKLRWIICISIV